jgi:hypothetical protein
MGRMLNPNALQPARALPVSAPQHPRATPAVFMPGVPVAAEPINSLRTFAFYSGMSMLLVRMAVLPETLYYIFHINTYLLYVVGPPALIGILVTGAIGRTLKHRAAWYWMAFFVWMAISVPFSSWVGGSVASLRGYIEFTLPMLFIMGGLAANWKDVRIIFYTLAASGLINVVTARIFDKEENGRIGFQASTTIGNSNDLSSQLVLILPFVLFVMLDRRRSAFLRYTMTLPIAYGVWVILGTASRGAMLALFAVFLFVVLWGSPRQRMTMIVIGGCLALAAPVFLGTNAVTRLGSLFGKGHHAEAEESGEARQYLLRQSIIYTFQHPVFGIGLEQFPNYEGGTSVAAGKAGSWHETHNAWTQVSSECGIPAAIFFMLGVCSAFAVVNKTYRQARRGGYTEIANACFCYLVALVGYMVTITFLANAYRFYVPIMVGVAVALSSAAAGEMSANPEAAGAYRPRALR